ncbi:MAG: polysaccharide deacetylase family protein [Chitinophagaceae bacterium]|nr:polysaccharide deacetylase family protein [Chitinophagaceae bacterium]
MKILKNQQPAGVCFVAIALSILCFNSSCELSGGVKAATEKPANISSAAAVADTASSFVTVDAATILNKQQVPVLCYHQIRDWRPSDSKTSRDYIVPVAAFREQMKMLADSGYHAITPDQLHNYLTKSAALPAKPIMLTYDDTDFEQYSIAKPEMEKYGFKGVFFIMTVSMGRPHYMSREQVKELSDSGHIIGTHTWNHENVKKYEEKDWSTQVEKPTKVLESLIGKPVKYFAYPFGLWNKDALPKLRELGFKGAFQLSTSRDTTEPLYTIRRIIVPGTWNGATLHTVMKRSFK